MPLRDFLTASAAALMVMVAADALWLGLIARGFYASALGGMLRADPLLPAAAVFYLGYAAGVVFFAVATLPAGRPLGQAALRGALLGLLAYGTYDLTNLATLRDWPAVVSVVDMVWGTALTAAMAAAGCLAVRRRHS